MLIQLYPTGEVRWQGFDPNVIETIKQIPAKDRAYSPETKTWTVQPSQHAELARLLTAAGHEVAGQALNAPQRPSKAPGEDGWLPTPISPLAQRTEAQNGPIDAYHALLNVEAHLMGVEGVMEYFSRRLIAIETLLRDMATGGEKQC